MYEFMSGAIFLGCAMIAVFFARFWSKSRDRFFLFFASAFVMLAVERLILVGLGHKHEFTPWVYVVRLVAFLVILWAIVDKNRASTGRVI